MVTRGTVGRRLKPEEPWFEGCQGLLPLDVGRQGAAQINTFRLGAMDTRRNVMKAYRREAFERMLSRDLGRQTYGCQDAAL